MIPITAFRQRSRSISTRSFPRLTEGCTPLKTQSRKDLAECSGLPILFHYTSAEATKSILTSKSLWATHVQFLSDRTEFHHGTDLVRELLSQRAIGQQGGLLRLTVDLLDTWLRDARSQLYIVCFSSDRGNRFSQWARYGDGGRGFSIGFDYKKLWSHCGFARVRAVTYDTEVHKRVLATEIQECSKVYESAVKSWPTFQVKTEKYCASSLVSLLVTECAAFKHPRFEEEREFRLVAQEPGCPKPSFRTGGFGITPYVVVESPGGGKLPVVRVRPGPAADRESAEKGINMLLADLEYEVSR